MVGPENSLYILGPVLFALGLLVSWAHRLNSRVHGMIVTLAETLIT